MLSKSDGLRFSFVREKWKPADLSTIFFYSITPDFLRTLQVRFLARPEKATFGLFDVRLRFDSWKMVLVDKMIVGRVSRAGFRFSSFEKSENQLSSGTQLLFYSIIHYFSRTLQVRFLASPEKRHLAFCLFQNDVSGSIPERLFGWVDDSWMNGIWVSIFFLGEKRKPAVFLTSTVFYSIIHSFSRTLLVLFLARPEKWHLNLFQNDVSGSIPEKWVSVEKMMVERAEAGLRFSSFEKSENQLFFRIQLFFYSIIHFFQGRSRFDSWCVRRSGTWNLFGMDVSGSIPGRLFGWLEKTLFVCRNLFGKDVSGSIPERWVGLRRGYLIAGNCWFPIFFVRERRKPALFLSSTVFLFQSNIFFKDASGSIPGASRKVTVGFGSVSKGHLRFDFWKMVLVESIKIAGFRFFLFEKSENQLFFDFNFLNSIIHFFLRTRQVRFLARPEVWWIRKTTFRFETYFIWWTSQVRFLKDGFGWWDDS